MKLVFPQHKVIYSDDRWQAIDKLWQVTPYML